MKRMLALLLALCLAMSLCAASAEETETPKEEQTAVEAAREEEPVSPEDAVVGFLKSLGIDTAGLEAELSTASEEVKTAASDLFASLKEGWGEAADQMGEGFQSLLTQLNVAAEQTKSSAGTELEKLRAVLEALLKEAREKAQDSELIQALSDLLEDAKHTAEDDLQAVSGLFAKLVEVIQSEFARNNAE